MTHKKDTKTKKTKQIKVLHKQATKINTNIHTNAKKLYNPSEAFDIIKSKKTSKFDETIEVHCKLGIDPRDGEQQVRGNVTLSTPLLRYKKLTIFTDEPITIANKTALEITQGGQELINLIKQTGKCDFDIAIAKPAMMPKLAGIAKILGPKGLMPAIKNETVTNNLAAAVNEIQKGKMQFKNDNTANVHVPIGKKSFTADQLSENLQILIQALKKSKPNSSKGSYIKSLTVCSTMGPGIKINTSTL